MNIKAKFAKMDKMQKIVVAIMLTMIIPIITSWIATQYVAHLLAYQEQLSDLSHPIWKIYQPFAIFKWRKEFYNYAPQQFDAGSHIAVTGFIITFITFFVGMILAKKNTKTPTSHGSARWATEEELEKTGLLKPEGVILGLSKTGKYIRHDGPEHICVYAPTRSGKGVGIIIPTLLVWKHSVVVTDIKGENWGITAGYRKEHLGNKVIKFDPTCIDGSGARYNPLNEIRIKTIHEIKDTQRIVNMVVDPQGKGDLDHWGKTASTLLTGLILHGLWTGKHNNLTGIASLMSDPDNPIDDTLEMMMNTIHDPTGELIEKIYGIKCKVHPKIAEISRDISDKPDNERGSVISTAASFLALYRDPIIMRNTQVSDFKIDDLMNYDSPVSLYLVIPPSDLDRVFPLTRLIITQIISKHTEKMEFVGGRPVVAYKHKLLLLIDEFPAFGRIDLVEKALAFIAGYGLKALAIIQSINQLNKAYTRDNAIMDNNHIRIAFTPNDNETGENISKALGTQTIYVDSYNYDKGLFCLFGPHKSGRSEQGRALMTMDEVKVMPPDEEIIFVAGFPPIKAQKLFYYKDSNLTKRLKDAPAKSDCTIEHNVQEPEPVKLDEYLEEDIDDMLDNEMPNVEIASNIMPAEELY